MPARCLCVRCPLILILLATAAAMAGEERARGASAQPAPTFVADDLGKGTVTIDDPWQFHLGDDPAWANPDFDDSRWERLTAGEPWGAQGHKNYTGYAWYRRHVSLSTASGASRDIALLIPAIDDVYELYWNGGLFGHLGSMPPHLLVFSGVPAQTYGLGPVRDGVLAVRVFKLPLGSTDDGIAGGFEAPPIVGSPEGIAAQKGALDFRWLRRMQFRYGLTALYGLVALISLFAWLRDRKQRVLMWVALYACSLMLETPLFSLRIHYSAVALGFFRQNAGSIREISLWFLLLWLLRLNENKAIVRIVRAVAIFCCTAAFLDSLLGFMYSFFIGDRTFEIADAALTLLFSPAPIVVLLLVGSAFLRSRKLDSARWMVAIVAFLNSLFYFILNTVSQGVRYTHWTLGQRMTAPLFELNGNPISLQLVLRTLLFLSIIYASVRYAVEERRRQAAREQEFQNARELQQVLIPQALPQIPGFALTSAYKPAMEVGGDFFQIIALEGSASGSTLIVLGDVSGKGLKAAMAVSLIVGAIRTLAEITSSPAEILTSLNRGLFGRLSGGFATAIAFVLDSDGRCTIASAGHPSPFLNASELSLPGELPLGVAPSATYEETRLQLNEHDRLAFYTDGLLEARNASGELYGFGRLKALFAAGPTAAEAAHAAVVFGQDDDITVLTFARLAAGEESTAQVIAPILSPA
jgi:Stage II sporulation protein E (SpoIIE)